MNKSIKYFSLALLFLFLFSFISAQGCSDQGWKGFAKLNENKTICVTCPTCDYINISSINPEGQIFLFDQEMLHNGSTFCYEFTGEQINQIGVYQIDGYSQLDIPLGLCFDSTLSGNEPSAAAYIIAIILVVCFLIFTIWINVKFNSEEREKLWHKIVTQYFTFTSDKNKSNLAYALLYTLAYAILRMIFVVYYLIALVFIFIFTEMVIAFSINTFLVLMPQVLNIVLLGLVIIFVVFMAIFLDIIFKLIKDVGLMMRGTWGE